MKRLFKNTSNSLLLIVLLLTSGVALADSTRGLVTDVQGNVFVIRGQKTYPLRVGSQLEDFDEILTETDARVAFSDYYGHYYFLSGSAHLKVYNRMIELKGGYLWLKNQKDRFSYSAQTANAVLSYDDGEGILSFDPYAGKTQFLNIHGDFNFGNVLQKEIKTPVREGSFTYIDNKLENGVPRRPTPIGYDSYKKIVSLFQGLDPAEEKDDKVVAQNLKRMRPQPKTTVKSDRSIASVPVVEESKEGKIKVLQDTSVPVAAQKSAVNEYLNKNLSALKKKVANRPWRPKYQKKSGVKVKVFGARSSRVKKKRAVKKTSVPTTTYKKTTPVRQYNPTSSSRAPASVNTTGFTKTEEKDPFEKSLMDAYKKQQRHSKEVNSLINDLKNYRQDYQISY